jgi:hypothetical protein
MVWKNAMNLGVSNKTALRIMAISRLLWLCSSMGVRAADLAGQYRGAE